MFDNVSELIKQVSVCSHPGETYYNSFVSRYKMYRKTKIIKQRVLAISGVIAVFVVAYLLNQSIINARIDIPTSSGTINEFRNR